MGIEQCLLASGSIEHPAFAGINYSDEPSDPGIPPIDIIKLALTGADILIPDSGFHAENKHRCSNYKAYCEALQEIFGLDNKVMVLSELEASDPVLKQFQENIIAQSDTFREIILSTFTRRGESAVPYVLREASVCRYMNERLGYKTKVGPVAEREFDSVTSKVCPGLTFAYTIPAYANSNDGDTIVSDYIPTSKARCGVKVYQRVLLSDSTDNALKKLETFSKAALEPLYLAATYAGIRAKGLVEDDLRAPESKELLSLTKQRLFNYVLFPLMKKHVFSSKRGNKNE